MRHASVPKAIGQRIRECREARGMTQVELARIIGVKFQMIQAYERGQKLTIERLAIIVDVLDARLEIQVILAQAKRAVAALLIMLSAALSIIGLLDMDDLDKHFRGIKANRMSQIDKFE